MNEKLKAQMNELAPTDLNFRAVYTGPLDNWKDGFQSCHDIMLADMRKLVERMTEAMDNDQGDHPFILEDCINKWKAKYE